MRGVKIDLRNRQRERLFRVEVDPRDPPSVVRPAGTGGEPTPDGAARDVYLEWDGAFDDRHHLRRCPACGCRELFARKDFPQITGFAIVVAAAVAAMALFGANEVIWGLIVLGLVALIDAAIYLFSGRCLVCYRCRTEFRETPIRPDHPNWELATGEKYRHLGDNTPQAETK
jgi:hypothetical protein